MTEPSTPPTTDPNQNLVDVFKQLTRVMRDNNTSDATDPGPFSGSDEKWDEFYAQLRTTLLPRTGSRHLRTHMVREHLVLIMKSIAKSTTSYSCYAKQVTQ
jgi:hypothetical protein